MDLSGYTRNCFTSQAEQKQFVGINQQGPAKGRERAKVH